MPWGTRSLNLELLRGKRDQRELHFRKVAEELKQNEHLNDRRKQISDLSLLQLRDELQSGRVTASEAVDAFRWKSLECHQKYNCLVEFVNEAPEIARNLDNEYKEQGKTKPALFGIPFSVKENIYLEGYDSTAGLSKWIGQPAKEDNSLVAHLRMLGAVPIVRTNVPQTCVSFTCSNCLFGTTSNPYDKSRTPGGSSGGEGCLIGAGGCPFGIGSDIGGSLRIPAHFCGTVTIKPTSARPKVVGGFPGIPGVTEIALSYGFFTKDVASQCLLLELTLVPTYFRRVPKCVPLPFNSDLMKTEMAPLRIGYYFEDGWFASVPACKRAVDIGREILASLGHQLIPFEIPKPEHAVVLMTKCLFIDNGSYLLNLFKDENVDENLKITKTLLSLPLWIRWFAGKLVSRFDQKGGVAMNAYVRDLNDLRATFEQVDIYVKEFMDYWRSLNLDGIVGTVLPFPALPHNAPMKLSHGVFGTMLYNLLDFPAGVVNVTTVNKSDETQMEQYPDQQTGTRWFQHPVHKLMRESMKGSEGLPVGVQIITLPYQEELCLKIMRDIENGVQKGKKVG